MKSLFACLLIVSALALAACACDCNKKSEAPKSTGTPIGDTGIKVSGTLETGGTTKAH